MRLRWTALALCALTGCDSCNETPRPEAGRTASLDASVPAVAPEAAAPARDAVASMDVPAVDTAPPAVLTLRVVNAGATPMTLLTNEDINELIHTRKLHPSYPRRPAGATNDGSPVKFFSVGEMPLCSSDAGAGYGGLGQPLPRTLAPGEAMEFRWDGQQRREVLRPERGVCLEIVDPEPGHYRFEFDQPYRAPSCTWPVIQWPLAPDAPRTIDIRCRPRTDAGS